MFIGIRPLFRPALFIVAFTLALAPVQADTNAWIKSTDGNWAETNAWSAGRLPLESDEVTIDNGPATVTIDSSTTQLAPSSLSISKLTVWYHTLFLDNIGDATFHVANMALAARANFIQNGGSSRFSGVVLSGGAVFARTNAAVAITNLSCIGASSIQVGGTTWVGAMTYYAGTNIVENGVVHIDGALGCYANEGMPITFIQNGGTTEVGSFWMMPPVPNNTSIRYTLDSNGVFITRGSAFVGPKTVFTSVSGSHVVSNSLTIQGSARYYPPVPTFADYNCGGQLTARTLVLDQSGGFSRFSASGEAHISENISFIGNSDYKGTFSVSGLVTCSNLLSEGTVVDIYQTSGALIVSNLFSFADSFPGYYINSGARPALYSFTGGTLSAHDMVLGAEWVIQSSNTTFRVSNPGTFKMGGLLHLIDGAEHLGRFILSSNAVIDLAGASANLSFENSRAQQWKPSAVLVVSNWDGSVSGGGVDRLAFGDNSSGLTDAQLAQIRFVNPTGFTNGIYEAQMLSDGEVVPNAFIALPPTTTTTPPPTTPPPNPGPEPTPTPAPQGGKIVGLENFTAVIQLFATSNAPAGPSGNLRITAHNRNGTNVGQMQIMTRGLDAGSYDVTATRKSDHSTNILGQITLTGTNSHSHILVSQSRLTLPLELSAMDIRAVVIGDDRGALLVGDVMNASGNSLTTFDSRVRVVSTNTSAHGTAILKTMARRGNDSGKITMTVVGLMPNTAYHVFVNGLDTGTVTSTKRGNLMVTRLGDTDLRTVSSVQLRDNDGNTVAEAIF